MSNDPILDTVEDGYRLLEEKLTAAVEMTRMVLQDNNMSPSFQSFHLARASALAAAVAAVRATREVGVLGTIDDWMKSREWPILTPHLVGCDCQECAGARRDVKRIFRIVWAQREEGRK